MPQEVSRFSGTSANNSMGSLQGISRRIHSGADLDEALVWMQGNGSSVVLSWGEGEDLGRWECSWITGGKRYTGIQQTIRMAILESLNKRFLEYANQWLKTPEQRADAALTLHDILDEDPEVGP